MANLRHTSYNTGYTASLRYAQIGYRRLRIARFRYVPFAKNTIFDSGSDNEATGQLGYEH